MHIEDQEALNSWLVKYIEPRCGAEPSTLAKYILALLKKNKPEQDLRDLCLSQLQVFLESQTESFVEVLFATLSNNSYLTPNKSHTLPVVSNDAGTANQSCNIVEERLSNKQTTRSRSRSPKPRPDCKRVRSRSPDNRRLRSQSPVEDSKRLKPNSPTRYEHKEKDRIRSKKRCRDYDDKGYCMRGDTCIFDHGSDPVVLDPVNASSMLGLSGPNAIVTEPYSNPEASEPDSGNVLNKRPMSVIGSYSPSLANNFQPQPTPSYWSSNNGNQSARNNSNHHTPAGGYRDNARYRENNYKPNYVPNQSRVPVTGHSTNTSQVSLNPAVTNMSGIPNPNLNVPPPPFGNAANDFNLRENLQTVQRNGFNRMPPSLPQQSNNNSSSQTSNQNFRPNQRKVHALNQSNENSERCTLEIRRIPVNLNTISNLNDHFKVFGNIVNIQVGLEGDAEAALVQFSSNQEAFNAYKSTGAVLNNRFIRVFWYRGAGSKNTSNSDPKTTLQVDQANENGLDTLNSNIKAKEVNDYEEKRLMAEKLDRPTTEENSKAAAMISSSISNSVPNQLADVFAATTSKPTFNPSLLKKQYLAPASLHASTAPAIPVTFQVSTTSTLYDSNSIKKDMLLKKLDLQKKRQGIIESLVKKHKGLLDKFTIVKNDKEKQDLRNTLQMLSKQIKAMEESLRKDAEEILAETNKVQIKSKGQVEKELVEMENELHLKISKGESIADLQNKLSELRSQAKALGIVRPPTKPKFIKTSYGGKYDNVRKVDRRTKKMIFTEIQEDDKLDLLSHLTQYVEVDSIECTENGAIVTYKNRRDAEIALPQIIMNKFKNRTTLKYAWYEEKSSVSVVTHTITPALVSQPSSEQTKENFISTTILDKIENESNEVKAQVDFKNKATMEEEEQKQQDQMDVSMSEKSDYPSLVDSSFDQQLLATSGDQH